MLSFYSQHESILRLNLKSPIEPIRTINCSRSIWFPSKIQSKKKKAFLYRKISENWIVERTYPLPIEVIPTQFAKYNYTAEEEERQKRLINSDVSRFAFLIVFLLDCSAGSTI